MKFIKKYLILALFIMCISIVFNVNYSSRVVAEQYGIFGIANNIPDEALDYYAQNNIMFYDPWSCTSRVSGGNCGAEITGKDYKERLREVVENYGIFFMNAQIEYGIPWEIPIIHAQAESQFGLASNSVAKTTEECGYYNWQGYKYSKSSLFGIDESEMGDCRAWHSDGGFGSMYENLADMFMSFYVDYLRNGVQGYTDAFEYASPENFDVFNFMDTETSYRGTYNKTSYCTPNCHTTYRSVYKLVMPLIEEVANEKGYPSSKELMEQFDIPKGGKTGSLLGKDIKDYIDAEPHSLSVGCGSMTTLGDTSGVSFVDDGGSSSSTSAHTTSNTGSSSSGAEISGSDITWIGDSYSCGALSIIKEKFSGISFGGSECNSKSYIMSNKGVSDRYGGGTENPPALTILKQVAEAGKLKSYLVMAIGTNAGWTDKEVNQFEDIMSSHQNTKVIFVNVKAKAHLAADDNGTNERLKALVNSNKNYYLADWAAAYDDKYFANDNTHPTANGGYKKWVEVISEALANTNGCHTYEGDYPQYYQSDYENSDHENSDQDWTGISYGKGDVGSSGCGPTSMAMLTTVATGQDVYPQDIIEITKSTGSYTTSGGPGSLDPLVGEKYGFEVEVVTPSSLADAENKMREYLQKGYMLHFSGAGERPFSSKGHYIGIFKIDNDDNVLVANSASSGNSEMKLHDVVYAGFHYNFTAIKGSGNKNPCGGFCEDDDNIVIDDDGLTFEQAKQFMMNYGANKNNSSRDVVGDHWNYCGGGGSNCATFSHFFVSKFTSLTYGGGDGQEVVDKLAEQNSSITVERSPRVWSVFSTEPQHTGIILGYHDGEWIVGHASCSRGKAGLRGKGNGGDGTWSGAGTGSGFVVKNSDIGKALVVSGNPKYAYLDVDPNAIKSYLENGE